MAFNLLERLEQGDYNFLHKITYYDQNTLINSIRKSENKINIINGFIKHKKNITYFTFKTIYDMEEYKEDVFELLRNEGIYDILIKSIEKIHNILNKTSWGKSFVMENLDTIISANKENINVIIDYTFNNFEYNQELIKVLSLHKNLHIRYTFMKYLVNEHPDKINLVYDDITKYLTSYTHQEFEQLTLTPELMSKEDICNLAIHIFNSKLDKQIWYKIKEFIISNYESNSLGLLLLDYYSRTDKTEQEFKTDADRYFQTSFDYKLQIYNNYRNYLSKQIIEHFENYIKYFKKDNKIDSKVEIIIYHELWNELTNYIDKYLSLSKRHDYSFLESGSTTSCYRIGDYAFKLNAMKWSYEDEICPNLYLILKNLEEHYIRDEKNKVVAGIEIQKYLSRTDIKITEKHLKRFEKDLKSFGYYVNDTLVGGSCGDNCKILDSYLDADCKNPEDLPQHFKEVPLVLIDRDRVYKLRNRNPKQIQGGFGYW